MGIKKPQFLWRGVLWSYLTIPLVAFPKYPKTILFTMYDTNISFFELKNKIVLLNAHEPRKAPTRQNKSLLGSRLSYKLDTNIVLLVELIGHLTSSFLELSLLSKSKGQEVTNSITVTSLSILDKILF